ncbi:15045_t:CDS:1, partial [Acaulospora morrowiae]
ILIQGYLLVRVWNEYSIFVTKLHWRVAFTGMVAMNVLNQQLFSQLWSADWSNLIMGNKNDREVNGIPKKGKKGSNERKKK